MITIRTTIGVPTSKDWPLFQMNVNNAFLQGYLVEDTYMEMPQGFQQKVEYKVCSSNADLIQEVKNSLHGNFKMKDLGELSASSETIYAKAKTHLNTAMRIVKYIKGSLGLGVFLKRGETYTLIAYCDSDWVVCPNTRRSITSYVVKMGDPLLSWKSKK
ncbi:uncharacterized protein LOC142165045 [Nicotiana tabacum]|uniref:Uncharacterized protein LOC142165045 n=1 Tax=Nicotiana tabacum TaxID=4097 RepID=A0AC58S486_TOBAC